ncbi:MAG: UvrD-helicase domain-containing protein [bacterium]|nr:UvrD-helicase domain-containing protein [bacterium]
MDYLKELNQEQYKAVITTEGPVLVLAGAGSGKTRVITFRILYLLLKKHVAAKHILAATFTNKAAEEMKERVKNLLGKRLKGLTISTFHSLGVRILRDHIELLGYKKNFNIYDEDDKKNTIKTVLNELHLDSLEFNLNIISKQVSLAKNSGLGQRYFDAIENDEYKLVSRNVFSRYNELLKNYNSVDFDDLIILPVKILSGFPDVRKHYRELYCYVLVDEYQDTNQIQYQFIKKILNPENNICVVGDDDQAIYGFRGSKIEHILRFEKDFKDTCVITLTRNYRSTRTILSAAGDLIRNNKVRHPKQVESVHEAGEKIIIHQAADEMREAEYVVDRMREYHHHNHVPWKQMVILYRTNFQSRPFEEVLRLKNIPYEVVGGMEFYDRKEIKDILSYLKVIANEKDELGLLRIINCPRRGIGDRTIYEINQYSMKKKITLFEALEQIMEIDAVKGSAKNMILNFTELIRRYQKEFFHTKKPMYKIAHDLVKEINYEEELKTGLNDDMIQVKKRMYNISELVSGIRNYEEASLQEGEEPGLYNYLNKISLFAKEEEGVDEIENNKVLLMSLHLSKGLEFNTVFLVGAENDLLPHSKTIEEGGVLEEERRLFYVGMTRARENLFITHAKTRKKFGLMVEKEPSPFLLELPLQYVQSSEEKNDPGKEREQSTDTIRQIKDMLKKKESGEERLPQRHEDTKKGISLQESGNQERNKEG